MSNSKNEDRFGYILEISSPEGTRIHLLDSNVYDFLFKEVLNTKMDREIKIPPNLINDQLSMPTGKKLNETLVLHADTATEDMAKYLIDCSKAFPSQREAFVVLEKYMGYDGEIQLYIS